MDIINTLDAEYYEQLDDLLAFISIYDDQNRTKAFYDLLEAHKSQISGKICAELGCGIGLMSEKLAQLGAKRVYAVERNPYLFALAKKRLAKYKNVILIQADAQDFQPPEPIDLLVQEFYGQMLYDEDLYVLENLRFKPKLVLPNSGQLWAGTVNVEEFNDPVVNIDTIKMLDNVLVSGLFDEQDCPLQFPVVSWKYGEKFKTNINFTLPDAQENLLYFGVKVLHNGQLVCQAGLCPNWSYVWTYRKGKSFNLSFKPTKRGTEVFFQWQKNK